jgi:hypothetical protein
MIFLVAGRLGRLDTRKRIFRRGKLLDNFPQPLGGATSSEPGGNVVALLLSPAKTLPGRARAGDAQHRAGVPQRA